MAWDPGNKARNKHTCTLTHTLTHTDVILHPVATLTLITALGPRSRAAQLTRDMTRCVCGCVSQVLGTLKCTSISPENRIFGPETNHSKG